MTIKADFNAEEWDTLVQGPALAGLIVVAAQRGGTIRESLAMAKVYAEAQREHHGNGLLGEIASQAPRIDAGEFSGADDLRTGGLARIGNAVALLESKGTPEEVEAYKRFTITVAERAAEADKSGGVLGIGGERVSDSEREALREIAATLGVEPPV
jgi:hypothetical protein